ncbi:MAG: nucleoside-diphosphate kinase [Candidatus Limimorpha sp.]
MKKAINQKENGMTEYASEAFDGFIIIKPGFLSYRDELYKELANRRFQIITTLEKTLTREESEAIYEVHRGKVFFDELVRYMSSGESIGVTIKSPYEEHGAAVIAVDEIKKQFRRHSIDLTRNVLHSSDSYENVLRESAIYFGQETA